MDRDLVHQELSGRIIGAAIAVANELKPGLDEKLYERALKLELQFRGHALQCQKPFRVYYRGHHIGTLVPDMVVDEKVLVDTKVVTGFTASHVAQMIGYLTITGLQLALLLNFSEAAVQWKRVVLQPGRDESAARETTKDQGDANRG